MLVATSVVFINYYLFIDVSWCFSFVFVPIIKPKMGSQNSWIQNYKETHNSMPKFSFNLFYKCFFFFKKKFGVCVCVCFNHQWSNPKWKKNWAYNHIPISFVTNDFMSTHGQYHARRQQHNKKKVPCTKLLVDHFHDTYDGESAAPTSEYRGGCSTIVPCLQVVGQLFLPHVLRSGQKKNYFCPMWFGRVRKKSFTTR